MVGLPACRAPAGSDSGLPANQDFVLAAEFNGPCERRDPVDVDLGNEPEAFVRAAYCQVNGNEPDAATVTKWAGQLRTVEWVRRIDVVRSLCTVASRDCALSYSDPWKAQVDLTTPCARKGTRDLGAVFMYWSNCPGGVNCGMDWANTHASGMDTPHALLGFGSDATGYYNPVNPGFWRRQLLDARWAGLGFLLLNTYGWDLDKLPNLVSALDDVGDAVKIAFFDDTWGWNRPNKAPPWNELPSFTDPAAAAQLIYVNKWKAFYTSVPTKYWYTVGGRPFVYFYNAGTLVPLTQAAATVQRIKQLFTTDFGVTPFVAVDVAFFADPAMAGVADAEFVWNTFGRGAISHYEIGGTTLDHFMAKWDPVGRDRPGALATQADDLVKGPELLQKYLSDSASSNITVIATWNDLGEGTGVGRNYDYYYRGAWLAPNAFMRVMRQAQCSE